MAEGTEDERDDDLLLVDAAARGARTAAARGARTAAARGARTAAARGARTAASRGDPTAASTRNTTASNTTSGYVEIETSVLQNLKELCDVLDLSYNQNAKEFGIKGNMVKPRMRSKIIERINNLQEEKTARFEEMRRQSRQVIRLWRTCHTPIRKAVLDTVFSLVDAQSCDEISAAKFLRSSLEDELKAEIDRLELAQKTENRLKYEKKKTKLQKLIDSTHLVPSDVAFDPNKQVEENMLSQATSSLRAKIDEVRSTILDRKELVFRIETARNAVSNAWPYKTVKVLIERARKEALDVCVKGNTDDPPYDGLGVSVCLAQLERSAASVLDASAQAYLVEQPETTIFARSTTRSGARFSSSVPEDTDLERELRTSCDWNIVDKKRMLHVVYRVKDLEATIKCYETDFGMKLLRKVQCPERRCTFAIVGFGPETDMFTLKLAKYDDLQTFIIGEGFGNVGITSKVHELCERIKRSGTCKIICRPARLKKDSTLIAVAEDINGYLFELIEKGQTVHMCHVMLRVSNIETSINFYEKALGMKLVGRKDLPVLKCTIAQMSYHGKEHDTCLELTLNYEVQQYSKGDTFLEITVGSDNVDKSLEAVEKAIQELGGKLLERPRTMPGVNNPRAMACFEDPDGYRVVMVDNMDFLKEAAVHVADDPEADVST